MNMKIVFKVKISVFTWLLVDLHGVLAPITCQSNTNTIFMALESQVRKTYCSHIKCTIVCKEKNFRLTEAAQSESGVF